MTGTTAPAATFTADLARQTAQFQWPGVLSLEQLAPGLFWAVSRNHGRMLALVEDPVQCYSVQADAVAAGESFRLTRAVHLDGRAWPVWVGEEGVDWRALVCASPAVHTA